MIGMILEWANGRARRDAARAGRIMDLQATCAELNAEIAMLKEQNFRLQAEIDRKSSMPGDHRYWEGRYRDEVAENEKLRGELALDRVTLEKMRKDYSLAVSDYEGAKAEKIKAFQSAALALKQTEVFRDAVQMLVERGDISAIECAQLNLGRFIPANPDLNLPPSIEFNDLTDGKTSVDFGMKSQATEAKFRQLKEHFQRHQAAVTLLLDRLGELGRKNAVTKEDLRKLREMREALSHAIKRTI